MSVAIDNSPNESTKPVRPRGGTEELRYIASSEGRTDEERGLAAAPLGIER